MATISKNEFEKSLVALGEALSACQAEPTGSKMYKLLRDAVIQRFEFCVEIAWKVAIKSLGITVTSPRPALREMLKTGMIDDIDRWFDFIDARNKSPHTYDEAIAEDVFKEIPDFVVAANNLLVRL